MSNSTIPFYHEAQSSPDTCFVHATNMYFQRSYINSAFIPQYRELVSTAVGKIQELVSAGALNTFYGEFPAPNNASTEDDVSLPEKDSDLSGWIIYNFVVAAHLVLPDITTCTPLFLVCLCNYWMIWNMME